MTIWEILKKIDANQNPCISNAEFLMLRGFINHSLFYLHANTHPRKSIATLEAEIVNDVCGDIFND